MSKICNRNYAEGTLFTQKLIDGVACCPSCEKPTICHGKPIVDRVVFWLMSDNTGISSKAIARHMTGYTDNKSFGFMPPSDASDRGRCIWLLELIPEWIERLPEMVKYDVAPQTGVVVNSSGIHTQTNGWAEQIPLIIKEGKL